MYTFLCEDSLDGILTGVYDAWSFKIEQKLSSHEDIHLSCDGCENYQLFYQYYTVDTSFEKAQKVSQTIRTKLGEDFYEVIFSTALSREKATKTAIDKADAIYQTIARALCSSAGPKVLNYLNAPYIYHVFELSRATSREAHHLLGFLRFQELENGVLFAMVHPKNNALPYLAEHFTDRFPQENFLIYDENHKTAAVHAAGKNYMIVDASDINVELFHQFSENEQKFQDLWKTFFENIAIQARINPHLQAQNIPKRFWKDAVELADKL